MTERIVEVAGARIFALDEGTADAAPIMLLHAGIADLRSWDAVAAMLVERGGRVVRFDRRGFGRTTTEAVDYSDRADVIAVLDALGIDRAVLVGNSMGGMTAIDTAIEHPERVVAVVGVGSGLGGFEVESTPEEEAAFLAMEAIEAELEATSPPGGPDAEALRERLAASEVAFWMDGPGQSPDRVPAPLREALTEMDRAHLDPHRVQARPIRMSPRAAGRLGELRCPVLAIAGDLDVSDVTATARAIEAGAPDGRAVIMPGVAHMIGMEAPERLVELIVGFVEPLRRSS